MTKVLFYFIWFLAFDLCLYLAQCLLCPLAPLMSPSRAAQEVKSSAKIMVLFSYMLVKEILNITSYNMLK